MSKLERYAHIAEIVGAITVVLSVLYLGYEIRRNTTASQMEATQNLLVLDQQLVERLIEPHVNAILVKARNDLASLSEEEREVFRMVIWSSFTVWEHAYFSHDKGVLDDYLWRSWNTSFCDWMEKNWLDFMTSQVSEESFQPGFLEHIDACRAKNSAP